LVSESGEVLGLGFGETQNFGDLESSLESLFGIYREKVINFAF